MSLHIDYPNYPPATNAMDALSTPLYAEVHHTDGDPNQTALDIDAEERSPDAASRGGPWSMIPYHFLVYSSGIVDAGRPLQYKGGATFGENSDSVSVCCVGDYENNEPSASMIESLIEVLIMLHLKYPSIQKTEGHDDAAARFSQNNPDQAYSTDCPGKYLKAQLPYICAHVAAGVAALRIPSNA
jgi:hypothetical protein